ncbi:MAG: DEAD/DEAH box helicase [Aquificae bacterium]|nr:DEAD/DEAH box helicase [Aquificota bacterium]
MERTGLLTRYTVFKKVIPPKSPQYKEFDFKNPKLKQFLQERGIRLYSHQADGIQKAIQGKNIVLTTPTASGKSFVYILSVLEKLHHNPDTKALVVFPLKALARDQYLKIKELIWETGIEASVDVYDGDTPREERRRIRKNPPTFLITTPDMLNTGILPFHTNWDNFFENLEFVVLDEIHAYRGVLGSHIANIIRRLKRLLNFYRTGKTTFITNSATIHNPSQFASRLIGEDVEEIAYSGAPMPEREVLIYRNMKMTEKAQLLAQCVKEDISTIVFVDSRKEAELMALRVKDILKKEGREDLAEKVSPYRSGYKSEERREIEFKLNTRNITVVISTSALEMGIDIGELEGCILLGYPGTLAQLWQRFGRAGRRDKKSYNILIPRRDALDQYFVKNPEELFHRQMEEPVINPTNRYILEKHLPVMAFEMPIRIDELSEEEKEVARKLFKQKKLRFHNNKLYASKQPPFSIRSAGDSFLIIDETTKKVIGDISEAILPHEAYPGAVYIHNGEKFLVERVDWTTKSVYVKRTDVFYITEPLKETSIDIIQITDVREKGSIQLFKGKVKVKTTVIGYSIRDFENEEKLEDRLFDPNQILVREFDTVAFWWSMPQSWEEEIVERTVKHSTRIFYNFIKDKARLYFGDYPYLQLIFDRLNSFRKSKDITEIMLLTNVLKGFEAKLDKREKSQFTDLLKKVKDFKNAFAGALHGVEHALIGIYPLYAMNDRWDIGGLSTTFSEHTGKPTIYIYDGYEGGVGYSEVGFNRLEDMIKSTYNTIAKCSCVAGCPSCIYSPKCGNSNDYLDKTAAQLLSHKIMKELS